MAKTIMVVDDEERLVSLLKSYLRQEGFRVVTAPNGREALFVARQEKPDLIVLDLMMPEMDGYEFMRQHRKEHETPIILLTAKIEDSDKVLGLELGADDYVSKPFSPRELAARVRAVLRRVGKTPPRAEVLRAAGIVLDRGKHLVTVNERTVSLTPSEFDLLGILMSVPGRVFSRLQLLIHTISRPSTVWAIALPRSEADAITECEAHGRIPGCERDRHGTAGFASRPEDGRGVQRLYDRSRS